VKTVLVLLSLFLLVGCANPSVIRVVEYGGGGAVGLVTGNLGGCAVHQVRGSKPFAKVSLYYKGRQCEVAVESKP